MAERTRIPKTTRRRVPITRTYLEPQLPERDKTAMATNIERFQETLAGRIDITKYSNYNKLLRVTARIMKIYDRNPKSSLKTRQTNSPHMMWKRLNCSGSAKLNRTWGRISKTENTNDYALRCAKMVYM